MHPSPAFRSVDRDAAFALIEANPFATLAVNGNEGPMIALAPMLIAEDGAALHGHLSRANPLWLAVQSHPLAGVAVFQGSNAYVSPNWYASKAVHGRVVPTWNYRAVEIRGGLSLLSDDDMMTGIDGLTNFMEGGQPSPWHVADAPDEYVVQLKSGIFGIRISIDQITAVDKLSQNKSAEDKAGVIAGLSASSRADDRAVAEDMRSQEQNS